MKSSKNKKPSKYYDKAFTARINKNAKLTVTKVKPTGDLHLHLDSFHGTYGICLKEDTFRKYAEAFLAIKIKVECEGWPK